MRDDGSTVFDPVALDIFKSDPLIDWEFAPDKVTEVPAAYAARYDALCVLGPRVTAATLAGADRRLRIVARHGVGYDSVDVAACTSNGVLLTITPDGVRRPVATMILTFILALAQKLMVKDRLTKTGRWDERTDYMGEGLTGKVVGSIGLGNIGREMFRVLRPLETVNLAYDPVDPGPGNAEGLGVRMVDFETVFRESDFVCINCPLSAQTLHLVGAKEFAMMKPSAYFINTARGPIVDEKALYEALSTNRIKGAAIDVFEQEPTASDNPILKLDNVITTPHSLCWTDESFRRIAQAAFTSVVEFAHGRTPKFVVNREVLQHPEMKDHLKAGGAS
jgi:phosphoglycerate dehydrogenase-like enzyme